MKYIAAIATGMACYVFGFHQGQQQEQKVKAQLQESVRAKVPSSSRPSWMDNPSSRLNEPPRSTRQTTPVTF